MNGCAINDIIGTPWVYGVSDCWCIVKRASVEAFGVEIKEILNLRDESVSSAATAIDSARTSDRWASRDTASAGSVVVFEFRGLSFHVGICLSGLDILHSEGSKRKPGRARVDRISDLKKIYKLRFYEYVHR